MDIQETTFYAQMQNCPTLDLRDKRGKRHDIALVLLGLLVALFRKRDGNLSSIHRSICNKHSEMCSALGIKQMPVISRSQLPISLKKVDLASFENLLFSNFGIELSSEQKTWFAGDGKELRGSIEKGKKRGEVLVQLVRHNDREVLGQNFYKGTKESEKPCLRDLIRDTGASSQKITADALHLNPKMTELIAENNGYFIIGLKNNQKELLEDMTSICPFFKKIEQKTTLEKGHGRIEKRTYFHYDISGEYFDKRWDKTDFKSLFKVKRETFTIKTAKKSESVDFYISNVCPNQKDDYFKAIRQHWSVEVNNHIRDVTLKEDSLKTKIEPVTKIMAGLRTIVTKVLVKFKNENMTALLDLFQDNFQDLIKVLRQFNFL